MAEDLTTMLTDGAQTTEDEQRLAGNTQDAIVVDPNASVDNPGGSTPTGGATDNTGIETAPDSQPPAVNVTADIPGPATYDTGGSGDVVIPPPQSTAPTNEPTAPQDPVLTNVVDTGGLAAIPSIPTEPAPTPTPTPTPTPSPSLSVLKVGVVSDGEADTVGEAVNYTITVTNTGNVTVFNIDVTDVRAITQANPTGVIGTIAELAPGASDDVLFTWNITQSDLDDPDGQIDNTATASGETATGDPVSESDDAQVPVDEDPSLSVLKVGVVSDGEADTVGEAVNYTITVTNTGNVTVYNIDVTDVRAITQANPTGVIGTIAELAPGASDDVLFTWNITQSDLDDPDGQIDNTATASGETATGEPVSESDDEQVAVDEDPSLSVLKVGVVSDGEADTVGEAVNYTITVTNTGNVTVYNIDVTDVRAITTLNPTGVIGTIAELAPGASDDVLFTWNITQSDLNDPDGQIDNTATASGETATGEPVSESDDEQVAVDEDPSLSVLKVGVVSDGEADTVGEAVNYTITVTNTGNVTVYNIDVTDVRAITTLNPTGVIGTIAELAPGASDDVLFTWNITQSDLNDPDGQIDNTATASGETATGEPVSESDDEQVAVDEDPSLSVLKVGVVSDGEADTVGEAVNYTITVTNTGNVTVYNIDVTDVRAITQANPTGVIGTIAELAPGASDDVLFTWNITQSDLDDPDGQIDNTATASGETATGEPVSESDDEQVAVDEDPSLSVLKVGVVSDGEADTVGEAVNYTITVTNTGNVTVYNIDVTDVRAITQANPTGVIGTIAELAPGASDDVLFTWNITQSDLDDPDGQIDNTATASGETATGEPVSESDDEQVAVDEDPSLSVLKVGVVSDGEADTVGEAVNYTITVTNTGNVTVYNIDVTDVRAITTLNPTGVIGTIAELAPGASDDVLFTWNITQSDLDDPDGQIDNTATASGETATGDPVSESDDAQVPVDEDPSLSVLKVGVVSDGEADTVGEAVNYTITVTNTGNVTVYNIDVTDVRAITQANPTGVIGTIAELAPGASDDVLFTWNITQSDLDDPDGQIDNTATASGETATGEPVSESDDEQVAVDEDPSLSVLKVGVVSDGEADTVGEAVNYTITVTNTGNVTVYNIDVTDVRAITQANPTGVIGTIAELAPGASDDVLFTWNITQSDLDDPDGQIDNTATASGETATGEPVSESDDEQVAVDEDPSLSVLKVGVVSDGEADTVGEAVNYTITVTNTGNVTVYNIDVTDVRAITTLNPTGVIGTIAELAPGASDDVLFTWNITQSDLDDPDGQIDNTATASGETATGEPVSESDDEQVAVDEDPSLSVLKVGVVSDGEADTVGEAVNYTITVTNTGNVTVYNIDVTDVRAITTLNPTGVIGTIAELAPGASDDVLFTWNITQSDLDDPDGQIDNTATASGETATGEPVSESDDEQVAVDEDPSLSVLKVGVVSDGEADTVGEAVNYTITVTNTGNVTVYNIDVTDVRAITTLNPTGVIGTIAELAPGASDDVLFTWNITQSDLDDPDGQIDNTATASGETATGEPVSESDDEQVAVDEDPSLSVLKVGVVSDGEADTVGEAVNYTITVTNTGNVTVYNIDVTDVRAITTLNPTGVIGTIAELAPGASDDVLFTWNITQSDLDDPDGQIDNTATASGETATGEPVSESDDEQVAVDEDPSLSVLKVGVVSDGEADTVGEAVNYTITVTNTGNVTVYNIDVTDVRAITTLNPTGVIGTIAELAPGASDDVLFTWNITQSDLDDPDGQIDNTATASGETATGEPVSESDDEQVAVDEDPSLSVLKVGVVSDGEADTVGEAVNYTITVTNTGNVTVYNIDVTDVRAITTLNPTGVIGTIAELAPGASDDVLFTWNITQSDLDDPDGQIDNTATASGETATGEPVSESDDEQVAVDEDPSLSVLKVGVVSDGEADTVGEAVNYTITVTNTGNVTVYNIDVTDVRAITTLNPTGVIGTIAELAPGASDDVLFTWNITQSDLDDPDGQIDNTATASGETATGEPVSESDDEQVAVDEDPSLSVLKVGVVSDGEADTVGEAVNYTITVTNTGNVTVYNIDVTDVRAITTLNPTGVIGTIAELAPGASDDVLFTWNITQSDLDDPDGQIDNTATASGETATGEPVSESDDEQVAVDEDPSLSVLKVGVVSDGEADTVGEAVNYTITVTNTGNVTVYNIDVTDVRAITTLNPTGVIGTIAELAPGASDDVLFTWNITQSDLDDPDGQIDNTATASGETATGEPVSESDDEQVAVDEDPSLSVLKVGVVSDGEADTVGEAVNYTITVTNTGNVTVYNIDVTDVRAITTLNPTGVIGTIAELAPGASDDVLFTWNITQSDLDDPDGQIDNTATASGETATGDPVSESDDAQVPVDEDPSLSVLKVGVVSDGEADTVGEAVNYTITVTNTGNVTVYNIDVTDVRAITTLNPTGVIGTIAELAPGASDDVLFTWNITQSDLDDPDGQIDNTATASGETATGDPVSESDDAQVPVDEDPSLSVLKVGVVSDGEADTVGEAVNYTITVTNTGNVTVYNIDVTDVRAITQANPTGVIGTIAELAPGASDDVLFTWNITQSDLDDPDGQIDNTATASGETATGEPVSESDDEQVAVDEDPSLSVLKVGVVSDGEADTVGEAVNYTITVTNTGNVTVYNIDVTDVRAITQANPTGVIGTIAELAPGASDDVLFTWNITQSDLDDPDGQIDNTATASGETATGEPVSESDDEQVAVDEDPSLSVLKVGVVSDGEADTVGEAVNYTITVTNTGNVTVYNIDVTDVRAITQANPTGVIGTIAELAPGASDDVLFTWNITQSDLDDPDGQIDNTATASGETATGEPVSESDDEQVPVQVTLTSVVDDEGLGGIEGGLGDLSSSTVPSTQLPSEAVYTGNLVGSGTFVFAPGSATIGTETVAWEYVGSTLTATITSGERAGDPVFLIDTIGSSYTLTLVENVLHPQVQGEQADSISALLEYTDSNGVVRDLQVIFNDDSPNPVVLTDGTSLLLNEVGASDTGYYTSAIGADDLAFASAYDLVWDNLRTGYELQVTGETQDSITYQAVNSGNPSATPLFEVVLTADSYDFTLLNPNPSTPGDISNLLDAFTNNNQPKASATVGASFFGGYFEVVIDGYRPTSGGGQTDLDIKISNTDLAVASNSTSPNDRLVFDIVEKTAAGVTLESVDLVFAATAGFKLTGAGGTPTTMNYRVVYQDSSIADSTGSFTVPQYAYSLDLSGRPPVDYVEFWSSNTNWKLGGVGLSYETLDPPADYQYDFHIEVVDADGDAQVSNDFSVLIDGDGDGAYAFGPVALDLNRDGSITYLSAQDGVQFDVNADGSPESVAWVAPSDGLLVYDFNSDRAVNDGTELQFSRYHESASTDLEGLSLAFDTNHDGLLDCQDENFAAFGVWQDLDQDGVTDEGEFMTLDQAGIASVDLHSDGVGSVAADGDVLIHGTTSVAYVDGTVAIAQDVALSALIDHVIADPTVLDATAPITSDPSLDSTLEPTADLGQAVDTFLATEPVTDTHLATYEQDVTLSSDTTISHDSASTNDATTTDSTTTTTDSTVYDPTHDSTVYDPTHDIVVHDATTYDHVV